MRAIDKNTDTVYINGVIHTADAAFRTVEAMAVRGDRLLSVGSEAEARACAPGARVVDLGGRTVLPGLIDSHLHLKDLGMAQMEIDCRGLSREAILEAVGRRCEQLPKGSWIRGMGWNQTEWGCADFPTREELDRAAPGAPVYLRRCCEHASWASTKAFELAGITADTPDPVGGEILRRADGTPTGMVTDQAQEFFHRVLPPLTKSELKQAFLLAQEELFRLGITTVHDAGSGLDTVALWEELYEERRLKLRLYAMLRVVGRPDFEELCRVSAEYFRRGLVIGKYDNHLTVRSFKISGDGSLGARSAWMLQDYADRPGHTGNGKLTDEQLFQVVCEARRHGFQVMVHSIGDACTKQVLDVYEKVMDRLPDPNHRCRIEHAQILRLEDIPRFAALGVIPSLQPIAMGVDKEVAETRLGKKRMEGAYAWRKLVDAGCPIVPISTDAPVDPVNPFYNLYAAVSRKDIHGRPEGGWYPQQALTRKEALLGATYMGACAGFEETVKGSLEQGKLADFVILDRDFMRCPEEEIREIRVLETVLGGETVYCAQTAAGA